MITYLPDARLDNRTPIARDFLREGCPTVHEACWHVWRLPYGRTSHPAHWRRVLHEGRGTCSSKHALIKALADERGLAIDLMLGIFWMHEANTPGVGAVLARHGLEALPEAHCYLRYQMHRIDLTVYPRQDVEPIDAFYEEHPIVPSQIGEYKRAFHRRFIAQHYGAGQLEAIWAIREECIAARQAAEEAAQ